MPDISNIIFKIELPKGKTKKYGFCWFGDKKRFDLQEAKKVNVGDKIMFWGYGVASNLFETLSQYGLYAGRRYKVLSKQVLV